MSGRATNDDDDDPAADLTDDELDDGPSSADIERFSSEVAHCPECGAEVWDDSVKCPECFAMIDGATMRHAPLQVWWRSRWLVVIVVLLVLAMLGLLPMLLRQ